MATTEISTDFERAQTSHSTQDAGILKNTVDDNVLENDIVQRTELPSVLPNMNKIVPDQSLRDFLARPMLYLTGTLSSIDVQGGQITNAYCMSALTLPIFAEKVNGFGGIRATTKVTLQVNGQKFQQGLYFLCYIPCFADNEGRESKRLLDMVTISQLPHVEIDVGCDTQAVLTIPYVHPRMYYNFVEGDPGRFFLFCYSPVGSGSGSLNLTYSIWVSYEDVELFAPTLRRAILQMGPEEDDGAPSASKIARATSNTFKEIAKVPLLSSVAAPVAWATGVAANTLSSFGWSKTTETAPVTMVQAQTATNLLNADGRTPSMPVGLFQTNCVQKLDSFGFSGLDEMSISYMCQRKGFYKELTWSDSNTVNTSLGNFLVGPNNYAKYITTYLVAPAVQAVTEGFQYWRGSLCFRFKVVKTEMHSGRLLIAFAPGVFSNANMGNTASAYLMRNIFDLRDGSEFVLKIPYINPKTWLLRTENTGIVDIRVLNPLRAPSTCAQTVKIIIEVFAGDDYRVAVPIKPPLPFLPGSESEMAEAIKEEALPTAILQMGETDPCSLYEGGVGGSTAKYDIGPSLYCIGEEVQSVKQLCNAISWFQYPTNVAQFFVSPFCFGSRNSVEIDRLADAMSYWSTFFAFNRGAVDMHIFPTAENVAQFTYAYNGGNYYPAFFSSTPNFHPDFRYSFESTAKKRVIQLRCPQYFTMPFRLNYLYAPNETGAPKPYNAAMMVQGSFQSAEESALFGRSASDDFQMGFFLGAYPYAPRLD